MVSIDGGIQRVSLILIIILVLATCFGCAHEYGSESIVASSYQRVPITCREDAIEQVWIKRAYDHEIDPDAIERVCELFEQVVDPADIRAHAEAQDLDGAIDRYLDQFADGFSGNRADGAAYWMAWLLVQSATRPVVSKADMTATRAWFEQYADEIIQVYDTKLKEVLSDEEYAQFKPQIKQALGRTRQRLQAYFDDLSGDPLFPIFKEPLGTHAQQEISELLERQRVPVYTLPDVPRFWVTPEWYAQNLDTYFERVPDHVAFWMALYGTQKDIRRAEYWGGMLGSASSNRYDTWPIEMFLKPMPALLRKG